MYSKELISFVSSLLFGSEPEPIDLETAAYDITCWQQEGIDLPDDLTPKSYMTVWNNLIEEA